MATAQELQAKLQNKLRELFQLNEPDLDFGFYRVMHAKAKEINVFLDERLPGEIASAFASMGGEAEADVYDHLYHFFERYYDKGDFVSLRYLKRETDHAAAAYAIPYGGEEVKLHWANADQYYIKTSENFSHFAFDAVRHPAIANLDKLARVTANIPDSCKVQFEIVAADEGDHGNIKQGKDRFFILHAAKPCETKDGTTVIYFEYREDPEQSGPFAKWQERRRAEAVAALKGQVPELLFFDINGGDRKKGVRPLLDVYLKRYFARNTADYFIHKNLGGFLRRELDFYIKNEMIALDDVTAAQPETVAKWLGKVQVFRKIANEIIDFLAQLEDFQKKLWLKKKFVVQCDYCLTMDRVPEDLRAEVFANAAQLKEWERLGFDCTENPAVVQGELAGVGTTPRADRIDARMVDTKFFDESFKQKLLASIDDFDAQCDGVLIHGENFQGLRFIQDKCVNSVNTVYVDPPYNADATCIMYKNGYRHSSWNSLIRDRVLLGRNLMQDNAICCTTIDDYELSSLKILLDSLFGESNFLSNVVIRNNPSGRSTVAGFAVCHEYGLFYAKNSALATITRLEHSQTQKDRYNCRAEDGRAFEWENLRKSSADSYRADRPKQYFPIYCSVKRLSLRIPSCIWDDLSQSYNVLDRVEDDEIQVFPIDGQGRERVWAFGIDRVKSEISDIIFKEKDGKIELYKKKFLQEKGTLPRTWWDKPEYSARDNGSRAIANLFGSNRWFDFPKAVNAVCDSLKIASSGISGLFLDYFAGSGTTAHAVIDLNRQDGGKRKYILIEMGDHFDTVLKPRIEKVVYSPDWKDGKPTAPAKGISHCFKYLRLESYEDALNNLEVDGAKGAAFAGISDYFLKYMLDVETAGSASLLNVGSFRNPFGYKLVVKKPASEEREERTVDLVETFNYLIGLRVKHTSETRAYTAAFERKADPELPEDAHTKLTLAGRLKRADDGAWKFRTVEGWCPRNRFTPNDGAKERVLVVWRTLTGDLERDNAVLNAFLEREAVNALDGEYDVIYVNGSNNVPNLRKDSDTWKVRLIEEDFRTRMWEEA